jgi:hypothetical protein
MAGNEYNCTKERNIIISINLGCPSGPIVMDFSTHTAYSVASTT